ncbi:MAG: RagB/SusD family nutrient uptake outer membrane protein [Dysgonamonadaceae bacterium]|jgi:hypothetical protein|nr:RagB/SusD family nutrient uptake outer membrane protein [Dysgonamonadaceae bacterium]
MKTYKIILFFALFILINACNDEYLDKKPIETQTEATAFRSYENFKTFAWSLYTCFGYNNNNAATFDASLRYNQYIQFWQFGNSQFGRYEGDRLAGYLSTYSPNEDNDYRSQNAIVPSSGGGWDYSFIRRVCLMLDNVDQSDMTDAEKAHWRSVGYFFHSYCYMEMISRFGNVQWVDHVIGDSENDIIYGPRSPRKEVADKVLENLQYAEKNIKAAGDGANTINVNCVRALMSRFCLFEGTWRKYHELSDADIYLDESIRVSAELMKSFPNVDSNYDNLMNSEDLSTYRGIILYISFVKDIMMNGVGYTERTSTGKYEMHKATVEMYLCSDGNTISNSLLYDGDKTMYDEFRNRDRRLLLQVVPPHFMNTECDVNFNSLGRANNYSYNANIDKNEYVELIKQILSNDKSKRLPVFNWSGTMNWMSPNVLGPGQAPMASRSGYYMWRNYNLWDDNSNQLAINHADKPLFYIEEVLLNYAEAMFERGQFNQVVADATINKLRIRANVAPMVVANINGTFDPKRDTSVDPVLWEIRRERMVELMGEGFGFQDIRRWKKGPWYINRDQMGVYVRKSDFTGNATIVNAWKGLSLVDRDFNSAADEGYLKRFINPVKEGKGWLDKYYLFPIPLNDLALNPELEQNPGW